MEEVQRLNPKSVLDLGVGCGLYGVACRQVLDFQHGRFRPSEWHALIVGREIFPMYANPAWGVYQTIEPGDFTHPNLAIANYELVLMIDSLEHIDPDRGRPFLAKLVRLNGHVIVSVPNGRMDQGEVHGNPYEAHRWTFKDLEEFSAYKYRVLHRGVCTVVSIKGGLHVAQ